MPSDRIQRRIERLLDEAEEAADQRNWEEVGRLSRQVLALDGDNEDAPALISAAQLELRLDEERKNSDGSQAPVAPTAKTYNRLE